MKKIALAVLMASVLSLGIASSAQASVSVSPFQNEIYAVLDEFPGGVQTSSRTIEWDNGTVVLELNSGFAPFAVGTCSTGFYCAFTGLGLSGSKLSFSTCDTTVSVAALSGSVRSIANARGSGYVQAQNSSGTTLATVYAGGQNAAAPTGIAQIKCVS